MSTNNKHLSAVQTIFYLTVSILINAMGNGLTVALNLGSAMWTASAVNISNYFNIQLGSIMVGLGVTCIVINAIINKKVDWKKILGNLVFMVPFSYLVAMFSLLFAYSGIGELPLAIRVFLDIFGIMMLATGVSIYQRVNLILHPIDELMHSIRFIYCKGNPAIAQIVSFIPPMLILIGMFIISGQLYAVNIGTLVSLLFQGSFVGLADKYIFPSLKHRFL